MASPIEAFTQAMEPVYKNLLLLLTIFILLSFGVYVSYILSENTNRPIYLNENAFDLFLNKSNINSVKSSTTLNGITIEEINTLGQYENINFCPQGQCSVNLSTGVKICPSTVTNGNTNNNNQVAITYNTGTEVCVLPETCPPQLPYAIRNDGSAFNSSCDPGSFCYCVANPQCATKVLKYFQNEGDGTPGSILQNQLNYSFSTLGDKIDNNILNNLIIDDTTNTYCQLNPAYTDRIINGCNFANKWNEPLNCENTNIFNLFSNNTTTKFTVANYSNIISKFKNLAGVSLSTTISSFNEGVNFIGVSASSTDNLNEIISQSGYFSINNNPSLIYQQSFIDGSLILLYNIGNYNNENFVNGLNIIANEGQAVNFQTGYLSNCLNSDNDNVNFKNMLNCVQPYNQPCSNGILAYNTTNPRSFCQGSGVSLSLNNLNNFFLINPAYYTLSCVIGAGCDDAIDTNLCATNEDCTLAFQNKLNKLFPKADMSALTNLFNVEPSNLGLSFTPSINGNQTNFSITNNFIILEEGDYWQVKNNVNGVYLTSNGISGSNIINVNNSTQLKSDMNINFYNSFVISNIIGTSVYLNNNLTLIDTTYARAGVEIITYSNNNYFGTVANIENFYNKQTFQLYNVKNNQLVNNNDLDIENNYITFYKQFGFNGLNYNTIFDFNGMSRVFSNSYYYKNFNNNIKPPFSLFELLDITNSNIKFNGLINENANFKQKYSMYYPVFNENYFQQECVYCSPSLHAYTYIDDNLGQLKGINIQFSGQDYYHYAYGNVNGLFKFNKIMFGLTALGNNLSNCSAIVLNNAINDLEVGDYIIDESGYLNKFIVDNSGNIVNGTFSLFDFPTGMSVIPEDKYLPFKLNNKIFKPPNNFNLNSSKASFVENVFYGKTYFENGLEYYILPTVQIVKISNDGKTIYTDSPSIHPIEEKKVIQFISKNNILKINIVEDPQDIAKSIGSGAELEIESITKGRITSIRIDKNGSGYTSENKPFIYITEYSPDTSLLNIST